MHYTPISPPGAATARFRPQTPAPLAERRKQRLMRLVAQFERNDIEAAVDGLIALLDAEDAPGDPNEPLFASISDGQPGDPIDAEPDGTGHGDPAWIEWHQRGRHKVGGAGAEPVGLDIVGLAHEDAEDDDPDEDGDVDEDDGEDRCSAGDDQMAIGANYDDGDHESWEQPTSLGGHMLVAANDRWAA